MSPLLHTLPIKPKRTLAVFAHPDDEAFGPGGTLIKLASIGELHLICVTNGDDQTRHEDLVKTRAQELKHSAKIIGAQKVTFLDYPDGGLSNNLYHRLAADITKYVKSFKPGLLLTFEPQGVSGHLDHIAVSMILSYVFAHQQIATHLWQYCLPQNRVTHMNKTRGDYFVYFPLGYSDNQIDLTLDVSDVWDTKVKAMKSHHSQLKDIINILKLMESEPKHEHFICKQM